jgi:hypothetical protein
LNQRLFQLTSLSLLERARDLFDAVKLLACYGAKEGDKNYDPNCNIDDVDGINLFDAVLLPNRYGQKPPRISVTATLCSLSFSVVVDLEKCKYNSLLDI